MVVGPDNLAAVWAFVETGELNTELRKQNPAVAVENGYLEQTPIKLDHALEWRLRLSAQAKGCLGNPRFSAFGCCSKQNPV